MRFALIGLRRNGRAMDQMMAQIPQDRAQLERAFNENRARTDELALCIAPSYACNCRCAYCYEQDKPRPTGVMSQDVQDAIASFVEQRHREQGFSSLDVAWYGGEPSLHLDVVGGLTERLAAWCDGHAVRYRASMISNGVAIDAEAARKPCCNPATISAVARCTTTSSSTRMATCINAMAGWGILAT